MSEHTLTEERVIDTNLTTATLAGMDERRRPNEENNADGRSAVEAGATDGAPGRSFDASPELEANRGLNRTTAQTAAQTTAQKNAEETSAPLFPSQEATELRTRWDSVQVGFVDEPRRAVEQADALVAAAMKRLAEIFAEERAQLEGQWDRGDSISTEDLRLALRRYRSFFGRVLSV